MGILRPAQASDLEALSVLVCDFFNYHRQLKANSQLMSLAEAKQICEGWLAQHPLLVYVEGEDLIGFVRLLQEGNVYWIENIGIEQGHRGQGHGRGLLTALETFVQERGQDSLYVSVLPENTAAIEFYVNNGYCTLNMIELRKDLTKENPSNHLQADGRNFHLEWKTFQAE